MCTASHGLPNLFVDMKQTKVILIFLFLSSLSFAQKATTFSGYVTDAITGEVLIGANIRSTNQVSITSSNKYGFFSFSTVEKAKIIDVSFVGYKTQKVILNQDRVIEITLEPEDKELAEVKITTSQESTQNRMAGVVSIPVQRLKSVPMVFGETDVLKALALTPGVNVGNEGTSGLLVRGGTPDQNLILLDDAHLYNQSHLFGFASTFNADAIKKIDLYKGAVPARFGGRLSSVVDVTMNDGNDQETKKEFSIGLLSSRFLIEGPIQKNKTSFMLSARSSYLSLFLLPSIIGYNKGSSDSYFNYISGIMTPTNTVG